FAITDSSIDPAERLYEVCAQFLINDELRDIQLETWFKMHLNALGPDPREGSHELLRYGHEITYDSLHRWLGILADEGHIDPAEVAPSATLLFTAIDGMALHSIITPERMTVETVHDTVRWTIAKILD
ncbi:TetR/AcrR family transcriptional regulator, partial [Burkholderia multivorans]